MNYYRCITFVCVSTVESFTLPTYITVSITIYYTQKSFRKRASFFKIKI